MSTQPQRIDSPVRPNAPRVYDRSPPHNLEAERNVLGSLLINPSALDDVMLILKPDDFYAPAHQRLYGHLTAMRDAGQAIDPTLLVDRLRRAGDLEEIGGELYLAEVTYSVPSSANAVYYARLIEEKSIYRALILASTSIATAAYAEECEAPQMLGRAEETIFAIHERRTASQVHRIHDVLHEAFEQIDKRLKHGRATGLATGFLDLDTLTGGLHESELVILAARPSMGKTALATNIAEHVAMREGATTLFVSLEMARLELAQRMLCSLGKISGSKFRTGRLSELDSRELVETSARLSQAPLYIDDAPSRSVSEIAAAARRLQRKERERGKNGVPNRLGLIVIDYLQLIEPDNPRDPRQEQVARIARQLKGLARNLKVPVLCLAQLNRQAESSRDNRPKLSHLRESGAIEQDADVVMFVHREEYYLSAEEREDPGNKSLQGVAELIIGKQRNGPIGEVKLRWFQEYTRFENLAGEESSFGEAF